MIATYVRRGRRTLQKWLLQPRVQLWLGGIAHFAAGFGFSAASLANEALPISMALVLSRSGGSAALMCLGGLLGYPVFWGVAARQPMVWLALALATTLLVGQRRTPLLQGALGALLVSGCGVAFLYGYGDNTSIAVYLLRVALAGGCAWLFSRLSAGRNPVLEWIVCALGVLALAQMLPVPGLGLGFVAAGALLTVGAFPACALAGLALDLARVTPVPMTAVLCCGFLVRLLPRSNRWTMLLAPAGAYVLVMWLWGGFDLLPLPGLLLGGCAGLLLPRPTQMAHRRGETGMAQVRLELAAGVLAQAEQLLIESQQPPVDEDALVQRAAEQACNGCPCRKGCRDSRRISQLPALLLHKPLLSPEELPIVCRKSGRFLAQLHRSQEQLRSIWADRERQGEYRGAVIQQFRFLSEYLQQLADQLCRKIPSLQPAFVPRVEIFGNRPQSENGDWCQMFLGTGCKYYVLLCDGMGTGTGAVAEGRAAGQALRRLLCAGYPAEYALQSLNSICALSERSGAVTVDLAQLHLDTGRAVLFKWGAAPSYLVSPSSVRQLGSVSPPPGLSVTDQQQTTQSFSLRREELLVMVSDGITQDHALQSCRELAGRPPQELATKLLEKEGNCSSDDATAVTVQLLPKE